MSEEKISERDRSKAVKELLESSFWLPDISASETYARTHDDTDGDNSERIVVCFSEDGDAWIKTWTPRPFVTLRYRMPWSGGGRSPRTRQALMILAYAIMLDNTDKPIK